MIKSCVMKSVGSYSIVDHLMRVTTSAQHGVLRNSSVSCSKNEGLPSCVGAPRHCFAVRDELRGPCKERRDLREPLERKG